MNLLDYKLFFSGITKAFIEEPEFYRYFIKQGFDPGEWPDCEAKDIALDFHAKANSNSIEYAQLYLARKTTKLADYRLPQDTNSMLVAFNEFKQFGIFKELGHKIYSDPKKGPEVLASFKKQSLSGVVTKNLKEEILVHIEKKVEDRANNIAPELHIQGWPHLSHLIGGFCGGRVIMLVAGTGVGKTANALNLIYSASLTSPTLFFNMEMSLKDIIDRICMMTQSFNSDTWKDIYSDRLAKVKGDLSKDLNARKDIFITDGKALTIEQISSEIFLKKEKHDIKIVFVDYDQKIRTKYMGEEWQTLQRAVEELEETAKATDTCIVILAQGDENNLPKASKRSMQSASVVLALYREGNEYFLETKKNRFGPPRMRLALQCDLSKYKVSEGKNPPKQVENKTLNEKMFER